MTKRAGYVGGFGPLALRKTISAIGSRRRLAMAIFRVTLLPPLVPHFYMVSFMMAHMVCTWCQRLATKQEPENKSQKYTVCTKPIQPL